MPETAPVTQYRDELIAGFEVQATGLRSATMPHSQIKGNSAVFAVGSSNGAVAVTRGVNGLIPSVATDTTQLTCTLTEAHHLERMTNFNIFQSQGNQRAQMQKNAILVINKKVDLDIIAQLDTATQDVGAAAVVTLAKVMHAKTVLGNAGVNIEDEANLFALVTPAVDAYLMQIAAYTSADFVESKPLVGPGRKYRRWAGFNWMISSLLTGVATSSEKCYFFHRDAIGHAMDSAGMDVQIGVDQEQAYSWARCSVHQGAKLLQNTGVVQMLHDGSAYVPT